MGYEDGWAALNLDMPFKIPRTEFSLTEHWPLIEVVTGVHADQNSNIVEKAEASAAIMKAWDFGLIWNVLVLNQYYKGRVTNMGHAQWSAGGGDLNRDVHCPFSTPEEVLAYDPMEENGLYERERLISDFLGHYNLFINYYPDAVNMSGTYVSLFSGMINIFGWEMLLLAGGVDMAGLGQVVLRYEKWINQFFEAYAETDIPVMMVHDDITWASGPVFRPAWYREYIFPAYKRLWAPVIEAGKKIIFTSDGDYTMFVSDIVDCGAHCLVMEPLTDMAAFAERYGQTHSFIGNADTRILLSGSRAEIRAEVERCINIGKNCPGFILAVGNHIPPNTPVESALYYNEVFEELRYR